jgi:hypothetical protein
MMSKAYDRPKTANEAGMCASFSTNAAMLAAATIRDERTVFGERVVRSVFDGSARNSLNQTVGPRVDVLRIDHLEEDLLAHGLGRRQGIKSRCSP